MKKTFVVTLFAVALTSSFAIAAAKRQPDLATKAANLSAEAFGADLNRKVTRVNEGICGSEGPSYIVEIQVRRYDRQLDPATGNVELVSKYDTVKTYGISESDLAQQGAPVLMDSETCLE